MCLLSAIEVHRLYLNLAALIFLNSWFWLELFQTVAETLIFGLLVQSVPKRLLVQNWWSSNWFEVIQLPPAFVAMS